MTHVKRASQLEIEWELAGLEWLREADGIQVVEVLCSGDGKLVEERLQEVSCDKRSAEDFGRALWQTHQAGAPAFGVAPAGWDDVTEGWIGRARLPLGRYESWGKFYAELRVLPYLRRAVDQGDAHGPGVKQIEQLCDRLIAGEFDDDHPPARIHGDLWAGNVICTSRGMVVIDPAAHGGHGESDLAMLALFGHSQLRTIQDAYAEAAQLDSNWRARIGLHQLFPLLVHTVLFGGGYWHQAQSVARSADR